MNALYERTANASIDEVGQRLERAVANHKFGVLGVIDLKAKMAAKGVEFGPECRIYEVCNPQRAKQVLEQNPGVATVLPCRIAVYSAGGKVKVAALSPTEMLRLLGTAGLQPVAEDIETHIQGMIDEAASA